MQLTDELIAEEVSPRLLFGELGDSYLVLTDTGSVIAEFDIDAVRCVSITSDEFLVITDSRFEYHDDGTQIEGAELLVSETTVAHFLLTVDLSDGTVSGCVPLDVFVSDSSDAASRFIAGVANWRPPAEILRPSLPMIATIGTAVLCTATLLVVASIILIRREMRSRRLR